MENLNSQNFGGEQISGEEVGIFSGSTEAKQEFISGNTADMERDMGVKALEGLEELAGVQGGMPGENLAVESGIVSEDGEGDARTEKGIDKLVEEAEKSSKEMAGRPGDKEGEYQRYRESVLQSLGHYAMEGSS